MNDFAVSSYASEAPPERAGDIAEVLGTLEFGCGRLSPAQLEEAALTVAARPDLWEDLVVDSQERRWWLVLHRTPAYEVRLLSWEFDQSSGWHDHAGSSGGYAVTRGALVENYRRQDGVSIATRHIDDGQHGHFGPEHVHDVSHAKGRPAVSVHAYSPPLTKLTMYEPTEFGFVATEVVPDDQRGL